MLFIMMSQRSLSHFFMIMIMIMFIVFAISSSSVTSKNMCRDHERQALVDFKQGLVDESNVLSSWNLSQSEDCCSWMGVTCHDQTGHVVKLDLSRGLSDDLSPKQPLSGEISSSLLELRELNYLDLSFNSFDGLEFPNFVASFGELEHLKLSSVGFSGAIPDRLQNLSKLQTLDLSRNYGLTVQSLDWLSRLSSLRFLNLSGLNMSNFETWPRSINQLHSLIELQLSSCSLPDINNISLPPNNFSDSLRVLELSYNRFASPSVLIWASNISTKLDRIGLSGCQMKGQIPDVFTNFGSLVSLDLSYNHLEGGLPKSFRSLCSLETLNLLENELNDRLYDSMKNMSCSRKTLKYLSLSGNPFSGPFPDLSNFSSLAELYLDVTNISGPIPRNLSQFSKLVSLSLAFNKLSGPLPDFTGLSSLRQLFLIGNEFSGLVPESLGQLSNLEYLDISSNVLNGFLTESHFSNLSKLRSLAVSQNNLSLNLSSDWMPPFQLSWIDFSSCRVGPSFPKWLLTQRNLSSLYIPNGSISDSIPDRFWELLTNLNTLNLSSNQIRGNLPNLSSTDYSYFSIDLSSNELDGPIPLLPPSLSNLFLSKNKFTGSISSLCKSQALGLSQLDLSDNLLSGVIPDCWSRFSTILFLNLARNNFTGKIPSSLSSSRSILLLRLNNNGLSGDMPSLENCTELRVVDIGHNNLSGRMPSFSGESLPKLLVLRLRQNDLGGMLPSSLCTLPSLHVMDFSKNRISGPLPNCLNNITALSRDITDNIILGLVQVVWKGKEREFGANLKHLRSIDISSNALSGVIPEGVTSLLKLVSLNLSRNDLVGDIPSGFDNLGSLESLDLSRNRLSGTIPESLASRSFLSYLDLSYNDLRGRIPKSTQLQSFEASSYVGNAELCGAPLTKHCPGDDANQNPSVENGNGSENDDDDEGFVSFGFFVSIGVGFFVGFWGVFGSLLAKNLGLRFKASRLLSKINYK